VQAVPKRPRFSRWRRLPGVFRTGEGRPVDSGTELDRIILYIPARILDLAEKLAEEAAVPSVQDYCALLLMRALENERVNQQMANYEARRGPLEGLKEIADDPEYLAEWQEQSDAKPESPAASAPTGDAGTAQGPGQNEPLMIELSLPEKAVTLVGGERAPADSPVEKENPAVSSAPSAFDESSPRPTPTPGIVPIINLNSAVRTMSEQAPLDIIARHVAEADDEWGFLPCLRRGDSVPTGKIAELTRALGQLEEELKGHDFISRRAAHALHRLALESQVMLTDAWPGAFNERMVAAIRTVQEAVERLLSGQDIRYYPTPSAPSSEQSR
jgi:hypothetical protein